MKDKLFVGIFIKNNKELNISNLFAEMSKVSLELNNDFFYSINLTKSLYSLTAKRFKNLVNDKSYLSDLNYLNYYISDINLSEYIPDVKCFRVSEKSFYFNFSEEHIKSFH